MSRQFGWSAWSEPLSWRSGLAHTVMTLVVSIPSFLIFVCCCWFDATGKYVARSCVCLIFSWRTLPSSDFWWKPIAGGKSYSSWSDLLFNEGLLFKLWQGVPLRRPNLKFHSSFQTTSLQDIPSEIIIQKCKYTRRAEHNSLSFFLIHFGGLWVFAQKFPLAVIWNSAITIYSIQHLEFNISSFLCILNHNCTGQIPY